jgi:hypothetical protein
MRLFRLLVSVCRRSGVGGLAECEHAGLDAGARKGDLEGAVGDQTPLANQLTELRLDQGSVALFVDVEPVVVALKFSIDEHPQRHGRTSLPLPHDEMDVAGVEAERHPPVGSVQHACPPLDRPVPRSSPLG